ncbi:hypothetical protein TIFTF001_009690 [Ficus carica]|uniref:Uncharacterized protein n=1 Tax=Ficus carica TaxID=3494 RepID=A0AA88A7B5_FICCA|nr:hypothetical protein TIFTF001_009690 [Ficus carica]
MFGQGEAYMSESPMVGDVAIVGWDFRRMINSIGHEDPIEVLPLIESNDDAKRMKTECNTWRKLNFEPPSSSWKPIGPWRSGG